MVSWFVDRRGWGIVQQWLLVIIFLVIMLYQLDIFKTGNCVADNVSTFSKFPVNLSFSLCMCVCVSYRSIFLGKKDLLFLISRL